MVVRRSAFNGRLFKPVLSMPARLKFLRGTPLDVFGYAEERKAERALIVQYERLIDLAATSLTHHNYDAAVALLAHVAKVRGYGPVKSAAMTIYQQEVGALDAAYAAPEHLRKQHEDSEGSGGLRFGRWGITIFVPRLSDQLLKSGDFR